MFYRIKQFYLNVIHQLLGDWGYFLYDERKHEKKILQTYYKSMTPCSNNKQLAIFMANGFCNHAGLCDRFKGMTTLYGWCKDRHIDFRIFHKHPFSLDDYICPNQYNWQIQEDAICYSKQYASVNHCMLNHLTNRLIKNGKIISLEKQWFENRISRNKRQYHFYTNIYPENDIAFGQHFQELFKPTPRLQNEIDNHLKQIGGEYISVSFRFMQLLGDFKDCDGDTLDITEQEKLINKSILIVEQIKQRHPNIKTVLVTADSQKFLDAVKEIPYTYIVEGKIGHINFENSDEVNMKTFLDFFMIGHAQKVYLAKSGKMYNSDFARRASMVYNREFEVVDY